MKNLLIFSKRYSSKLLCLIMLLILVSCGDEKIQSEQLKKEMEGREIKRITDGEFMQFADDIGKKLTDSLIWYANVDSLKLNDKGVVLLQSAKDSMQFDFFMKSEKSTMGIKEAMIYESYLYAVKNDQEIQITPQYIEKMRAYLYAVPLFNESGMQGMMTILIPKKTLVIHYPEEK